MSIPGAFAAVYAGISAAGNVTAAGSQVIGAVTGHTEVTETAAELAGTVTSASGMATLVVTRNLNKAATAAAVEGIVTSKPEDLAKGGTVERAAKAVDLLEHVRHVEQSVSSAVHSWIHPISAY